MIEDDDEALAPSAVDAVKPWTIKAIATEARNIAIVAARRDGMTVGQWLERVIRAAVSDQVPPGLPVVIPPPPPPPPDRLGQLERLTGIARTATPGKDSLALREARRQALAELKGLR